jgi:hypothetical protein
MKMRMQFTRICCLVFLLALTGMLPVFAGGQRQVELTNQPPIVDIVRFEVAQMPPKDTLWRRLPREDGIFILSKTQNLPESHSKTLGEVLPPTNDFAVRVITKNDREYCITFTTRAESVWIGGRLFDVPAKTSKQIVQKVASVLKKK